jgi:hypothetical protein
MSVFGGLTFYSLAVTLHTSGYNIKKILLGTYIAFVCCVFISEQTAAFALSSSNRWGLYNRGGGCLLRCTHQLLI